MIGIGSMRRAAVAALVMCSSAAAAQPFTYQGVLSDGGQPADGVYDLRVTLLNGGGGAVAGPLTFNDIQVSDGVFSVELDFGAGSFNGDARLLGLEFRAGASTGGFTDLLPNTPINPAPYALYALNAPSVVTQNGSAISIGAGDGSEVAIVNPLMPGGFVVNGFTQFQVNFDAGGSFGGIYVNGRSSNDRPFYGFANESDPSAFIEYEPLADEMLFWLESAGAPLVRLSTGTATIAPDLLVGGDLRINTGSEIRAEVGSVVNVGGTLSASNEVRSAFDTVVGDDLEVDDQIVKDYGTDEFRSAIPVAYGTFFSTGNLDGGTANISAVWDPGFSRYVVTIAGFNASTEPAVINVTALSSTPRVVTSGTIGGNVLVNIFDLNGNRVQAPFSVVVYDGGPVFTIRSDD